jgi:hypothetical protein
VPESFYVPEGDGYIATELTRGPWDPGSQHGGPPAALLGRELDRAGQVEGRLARVTYEILRPVPIGPMQVSAAIVRPGRRVEMVEGALADGDGTELMRARGWRIRTEALDITPWEEREEPVAGAEEAHPVEFFPTGQDVGYHTGVDWRFVRGGYMEAGPALAWARMNHPLIAGEAIEPRDRVLIAADSGNGISSALDYRDWVFINTDLNVNVLRLPAGEWVGMDATTYPERDGVGFCDAALHDERGRIGRATQSLLVAAR